MGLIWTYNSCNQDFIINFKHRPTWCFVKNAPNVFAKYMMMYGCGAKTVRCVATFYVHCIHKDASAATAVYSNSP